MPFFYDLRILFLNFQYYIIHPILLRLDFFLYFFYRFHYSISKNRHEKSKIQKSGIELTYGETPYCTLDKALSLIPVTSKDRFYDLGSGRGKLVFFLYAMYHIPATGIELIPTYIKLAQKLAKDYKFPIRFIEGDFLKTDFSDATLVFLTATCLGDSTLKLLNQKFEKLQKGSWVISASYPIQSTQFELKHHLKVFYSWGYGNLYLQQKV